MPALDEGSFLLMPTTMPHAGTEEIIDQLRMMDMRVASIPEVETVVGKIGRVESALDPAPLSMFENVILYKPEIHHRCRREPASFPCKSRRHLPAGRERGADSRPAWSLFPAVGAMKSARLMISGRRLPRQPSYRGVTSAPKLQPIETRLVYAADRHCARPWA